MGFLGATFGVSLRKSNHAKLHDMLLLVCKKAVFINDETETELTITNFTNNEIFKSDLYGDYDDVTLYLYDDLLPDDDDDADYDEEAHSYTYDIDTLVCGNLCLKYKYNHKIVLSNENSCNFMINLGTIKTKSIFISDKDMCDLLDFKKELQAQGRLSKEATLALSVNCCS